METGQHTTSQVKSRPRKHEGPKNHILGFIISLILTALAFIAVMNKSLSSGFVMTLIVIMAIVQAAVQLFIWMHMKDRGHLYPQIFIAGGAVVAGTCIVMAVYWLWW